MGARIALVLLATSGCGRVGFDHGSPGDSDAPNGQPDGSARTYLFQDGFEGSLAPWSARGNVVLDSGAPAAMEGASTLKAQANTASTARAEVKLARNVSSGAFFVRAYYYLPSGYPISDLSLLEIVQANTDNVIVL